jgi:RNA polymerase sigma factor (sigma-70 family)
MTGRDKEDFLEQVFPHQAIIHKICRMYRDSEEDRKDLFQEIMYQLWKAYPQFQERSKLTTWMYRIGLNTAIATFRKPRIHHSPLENHHSEALSAGESSSDNEANDKLLYAIRQLNEADRAFLTLYFEDMSHQEIGEILGISENNVAVRLTRIKERIRTLLNLRP